MAKRNKITQKKEPDELAAQHGSDVGIDDNPTVINSSTNPLINQAEIPDDDRKGRHFWYVIYPSEDYIRENYPSCTYDGSDGWGTLPDDWRERMNNTGLPWHESPLHRQDDKCAGVAKSVVVLEPPEPSKVKKPHYHIIVSWPNTTTYRTAKGLCKVLGDCPPPLMLHSVTGAYRYAWHMDNPEKYQYDRSEGQAHNGWTPPLDTSEVMRIKREIKEMILVDDIQEYAELLIVCDAMGVEYFDVASNNTFYCEKLCSSYRHNPIRVLMRYYNGLPEGDLKEQIKARIERTIEHESSNT